MEVLLNPTLMLSFTVVVTVFLCTWTYRPFSTKGGITGTLCAQTTVLLLMSLLLAGEAASLTIIPMLCLIITVVLELGNVSASRGRKMITATALIVSSCIVLSWGRIVTEISDILRRHPPMSLADRLTYEQPYQVSIPYFLTGRRSHHLMYVARKEGIDDRLNDIPLAEGVASPEVTLHESMLSTSLDSPQYNQFGNDPRSTSLEALLRTHRSMEFQFRLAAGFGLGRWRELRYRDWKLDLPNRSPIAIPHRSTESLERPLRSEQSVIGIDYLPWHTSNLINFAAPQTLGVVGWNGQSERPDLTRVVGFVPHGFASMPEPPATSGEQRTQWQIDSLQLVSLLKHQPGVAYVSEYLPNMNQLSGVPTRPLDSFEEQAVHKMKEGEDLIVQGNDEQIRMIGSVRASAQCLQCHQVRRGTLLGAFTYHLRPRGTVDQPVHSEKP